MQDPAEKRIIQTVKATIERFHMFQSADHVLMAASGGPDSTALVHILRTLAPEMTLQMGIAHLNHGLRAEEAERDAAFVMKMAHELDLPCFCAKKDVHAYRRQHRLSLENAARRVRYDFLCATARQHGFNKIALGHHMDDNAEAVLMFVLRGSGRLGLGGMAPVRGKLLTRPLIEVSRSEIEAYLAEKQIETVTDSSNLEMQFSRNRLRHQLIPRLKREYNPQIVPALNRLAILMRSEEQWLESVLEPVSRKAFVLRESDTVGLSLSVLRDNPPAVQRRLLRKAISGLKGSLKRVSFTHIEAVLRMLARDRPYGHLDLADGISIQRRSDVLIIKKTVPQPAAGRPALQVEKPVSFFYLVRTPGSLPIREIGAVFHLTELPRYELPDFESVKAHIAYFDRDKVRFPLVLRSLQAGDRFSPLGLRGTQKLKKFFSDHKVPRHERSRCPLLLSEDKIVWIAGHRLDNAFKVDSGTRRVLKVELHLA